MGFDTVPLFSSELFQYADGSNRSSFSLGCPPTSDTIDEQWPDEDPPELIFRAPSPITNRWLENALGEHPPSA